MSIVLLGRPNVGKSTLFNVLTRYGQVVHNTAGATRDRQYAMLHFKERMVEIVDTPGIMENADDPIAQKATLQSWKAVEEAEAILFVLDGIEGLLPLDQDIARQLRRIGKPIYIIINKSDHPATERNQSEFQRLGFNHIIEVSSFSGEGLEELKTMLLVYSAPLVAEKDPATDLQVVILGRPNMGKSTLINALLNEDRLVTDDRPGVTRDSIFISWKYNGRPLQLIDTAGLNKKSRISGALNHLSVRDTLKALQYAHVAVLVVEADEVLTQQDKVLANLILNEGRALVIVINKQDKLAQEDRKFLQKEVPLRLSEELGQAKDVPCIFVSALQKRGLKPLMKAVFDVFDSWQMRISTGRLNRWLQEVTTYHPPPIVGRTRLHLKYITQVKARPPQFVIFMTRAEDVPQSYVRYLQNSLRETFDLKGVPLRFRFKSKDNPYDTGADD